MAFEQLTDRARHERDRDHSQFTAGSSSISRRRRAARAARAAAARQALLNLASAKLGVPVASSQVDKGVVSGGGKTVTYGDLIGGKVFNVRGPAQNAKPTRRRRAVQGRRDARAARSTSPTRSAASTRTSTTSACRGCSTAASSARAARARTTQGATCLSVDESSIKHLTDAQVVRKGNFLGVVAPARVHGDPGRGSS